MWGFRRKIALLIQRAVFFMVVVIAGIGAEKGYSQPTEEAIGLITALEGEVFLFRPGETVGEQAQLKDDIFLQDTIVTGDRSKVKIVFKDDSILSLGENTRMEITEFVFQPEQNFRQSIFTVTLGKLRVLIGRLFGEDSRVQVRTPTAIAGVRGTYFIVNVISEEITEIIVLEGEVEVMNILDTVVGEVTLRANESTQIQLNLPPAAPIIVPPQTLETLKQETQLIEETPLEEIPQGTEAPGGDIKTAGLPLTIEQVKEWEKADTTAQAATVVETVTEIQESVGAPEPSNGTAPVTNPTQITQDVSQTAPTAGERVANTQVNVVVSFPNR